MRERRGTKIPPSLLKRIRPLTREGKMTMSKFLVLLVCLILTGTVSAKPPRVPKPPVAPPVRDLPDCGDPGCDCGCQQGKPCRCDKKDGWVYDYEAGIRWRWKPANEGVPWYDASPQASYQPYPPIDPTPTFQPAPMYQQPRQFAPSFGGGFMRGGGGRSGGC